MAERAKLTRVPPNWTPEEWWAHVEGCSACSQHYENPDAVKVDLSDLTYDLKSPVILEPRVEHLNAGDVLLLEVPDGVPASSVELWAKRAREVVPPGVTVMIVAGEARVLQPEEAGAVVQLAHERLRSAADAVVAEFNRHGATEPLELGAAIVELARVLDSVELVEDTVPRRQETYLVQKWFESERGWGQRPDGWSLHRNREELDAYVKTYWDSMPNAVPDEYSAPEGDPRVYPGSVFTDEQIAKLDESTNGARFWGYPPKVES